MTTTAERTSVIDGSEQLACPKCGCRWLSIQAVLTDGPDGFWRIGARLGWATCTDCGAQMVIPDDTSTPERQPGDERRGE